MECGQLGINLEIKLYRNKLNNLRKFPGSVMNVEDSWVRIPTLPKIRMKRKITTNNNKDSQIRLVTPKNI